MSESKRFEILFLDGPGFADQGDVHQLLRFNSEITLKVVSVGAGTHPVHADEVKTADLIVLRGPWSGTPEEVIYSSLMADRLKPTLKLLDARFLKGTGPKIVGIGRGALTLLHSELPNLGSLQNCEWEEQLKDHGPWTIVKMKGSTSDMYAQVQGRALPKIPAADMGSLAPWLSLPSGQIVGWKISSNIFISFVDILALADRSQLADFGYVDLSGVPTHHEVMELMISGEAFAG